MRKVQICAGVCGETVEATAEKVDNRRVRLKIGKCCQFIERMKTELEKEPLDAYQLMNTISSSLIYQSASKCLPHVTCPAPSGLHKLIEVEMGLAVPVDVSIKIE